jgi:hypothetical protein
MKRLKKIILAMYKKINISPVSAPALLLESGDFLLLETGDKFLLE